MRVGVVALATLVSACSADVTPEPGSLREVPEDSFVQLEGVTLHYLDWGGTGELLLFVPGSSVTAHSFNQVAPYFTDRFRVLAVTRRWHGQSEKTDLTFDLDTLADDLGAFIDHFTDAPAIVVGWSYAGFELPRLAHLHPDLVDRLVFVDALFDPAPPPEDLPPPPGFPPMDSAFSSVEAAADALGTVVPRVDRTLLEQYLGSALRETDAGQYVWQLPPTSPAMARFMELVQHWSPTYYEGLTVPVLAIVVNQGNAMAANLEARGFSSDSVEVARRWAAEYDYASKRRAVDALRVAIPDAQVVMLDQVSHNFPMEDPRVLVQLLNDYLGDNR